MTCIRYKTVGSNELYRFLSGKNILRDKNFVEIINSPHDFINLENCIVKRILIKNYLNKKNQEFQLRLAVI